MSGRLQGVWMVARRKVLTALTIVANCANWAPVLGSRLVRGSYHGAVRLRSGVILHPRHDLDQGWGEIFEAAIADVYGLRLSPPPDVIWDIGANIGGFCCVAAHAFPGAAIIAYEPDTKVVEILEKNVKANALHNVTIIPMPVTRDGRTVEFSEIGGGGSSNIYQMGDGPRTRLRSVAPSLAGLSSVERLFVKLDCEGAEGEIVEWLCEKATDLPPKVRIVAEYHPWCPVRPEESLERLRDAGFTANMIMKFGEPYLVAGRAWT